MTWHVCLQCSGAIVKQCPHGRVAITATSSSQPDSVVGVSKRDYDALKAEVARLREALETIAVEPSAKTNWQEALYAQVRLARQALKPSAPSREGET